MPNGFCLLAQKIKNPETEIKNFQLPTANCQIGLKSRIENRGRGRRGVIIVGVCLEILSKSILTSPRQVLISLNFGQI